MSECAQTATVTSLSADQAGFAAVYGINISSTHSPYLLERSQCCECATCVCATSCRRIMNITTSRQKTKEGTPRFERKVSVKLWVVSTHRVHLSDHCHRESANAHARLLSRRVTAGAASPRHWCVFGLYLIFATLKLSPLNGPCCDLPHGQERAAQPVDAETSACRSLLHSLSAPTV